MFYQSMRGILKKFLFGKRLPVTAAVLLAHLVFAFVLSLRHFEQLQPLELTVYDLMSGLQAGAVPPDPRITIVWCTDEDQRRWGWPLGDKTLVGLLNGIYAQQPLAVGLDIYRDLPVPLEKGEAYAELTKIFKERGNIFGIIKAADEYGARVDPPPALKGTKRIGFNDFLADPGGIIRRGILFVHADDTFFEYFGLKLALYYLGKSGIYLRNDEQGGLVLGDIPLPAPVAPDFGGYVDMGSGGYQFLLRYPGAPNEFNSVTLNDFLEGRFDPALFRDKIVIIGVRAEATPDFFYTPIHTERVAGASIHAHNISQLLRLAEGKSTALQSLEETGEKIWIWAWCLLGALACLQLYSIWRFFLVAAGGVIALMLGVYQAFLNAWWLPAAAPALGWGLSMTFMIAFMSYREKNQRAMLMNLFGKYVSKDVAEVIWKARDQYLSKGMMRSQRQTATVLFTDLQHFTTVSESMEPQALMDWLNVYMGNMVRIVEENDGQINKFIGDAIMAVFGIPIPCTCEEEIARDAVNAVNCALAMRAEILRLRVIWEKEGQPVIRMRVGIFTGPLVAGCLGGTHRQEYTVIGDTVNTASRLESFNKTLESDNPCRILIGEPTLKYLNNRFETKSAGTVSLKGKAEPVTIYQVMRHTEI
ncbi:MAG: adenylate/guanylate cyclase domain-containing protein [Gammaproteobacteria bacterium]|nr:adenylate/guanylate cyclase domain-containing protein [Gammaproteobacteria bacterium]